MAKTAKTKTRPKPKTKVSGKVKAKTASKTATRTANRDETKSKRPIYLTEEDVCRLVTVKDAIATLEKLFATWDDPSTINIPRQRAQAGDGVFNLMGAAWGAKQLFGLKAYYYGGRAHHGCSHLLLHSAADGTLKAVIESDSLGQMRTGAASGVATKILANPQARTFGVIGTGRQSFTQIAAVCAVRPIKSVHVFSRNAENRNAYARRVERELKIDTHAAPSAEAAVANADIVTVITKSAEPVLRANWLKSGAHVNGAGANSSNRREIDAETVLRATVRATDQVAQAQMEAGEYRDLVAAGRLKWQDIVELGDIVTGKAAGRRAPADITLFKSLGIALEDIAFADLIYRRALERGIGKPM